MPAFVILDEVSNANEVEAARSGAVPSEAEGATAARRDPSLRSGRPKRPSRTADELARSPEDQRDAGSLFTRKRETGTGFGACPECSRRVREAHLFR
jgi:hypothetical protein